MIVLYFLCVLWYNIRNECMGKVQMIKHLFCVSLSLIVFAANADTVSAGRGRTSMANQMQAAPRAGVASKNQIEVAPALKSQPDEVSGPALAVTPTEMLPAPKDNRETERLACVGNNNGLENTFIWASKFSDVNNYTTMVEDVENPENNTCFVKVELLSDDPRINMDDILPRYYEWGSAITCGDWVDGEKLRQRILDAKKKGRAWAIAGGGTGGALVGVGAMELFGNAAIGGKVQGQKALSKVENMHSKAVVWKEKNPTKYKDFQQKLKALQEKCVEAYKVSGTQYKAKCDQYNDLFNKHLTAESKK